MRPQGRTADHELATIASAGAGLVTRAEALSAGVTVAEIRHRLRSGALLREYPGVYRVGHRAPSLQARYRAAVLACGDGALLTGRAAAYLFGLVKGPAPTAEVIAPTERRIEGIVIRRCRHIDPRDRTIRYGIPITIVERVILDLAATLGFDDLARACHEAGVRYRTTPAGVEAALARRPNSPGAGKLRRILRGDAHVTLSTLERRFLSTLRAARLPLPETNRVVDGRRVDCRWPDRALTVELDSYRFHSSRHAWEQDRRREREARARGDEFRRYTYGDVLENPQPMMSELRPLLS
jgi:hypothetical protein